jgi:hypothetical protein
MKTDKIISALSHLENNCFFAREKKNEDDGKVEKKISLE